MRKASTYPTAQSERAFSDRLLDTLAQTGTAHSDTVLQAPEIVVYGLGTDIADRVALKGRAKRKAITQKLVLSLITVAEKDNDATRVKAYWNTYHCQAQMITANGRAYTKYCKNRFCLVCQSIRKAQIINDYLPEVRTWEDPHFVTLTVKSVTQAKLPWLLKGIHKAFRQILDKHKKLEERKTGQKLIGIRSLECNFNPVAKTYNPHLHILTKNGAMAETLVKDWLTKWTPRYTRPVAQNSQKVKNIEPALIEIVKYSSKIFVQPDMNTKGDSKIPRMVYAAALDHIFACLSKYHVFNRFGFNLQPSVKTKTKSCINLDRSEKWGFHPALSDWYNEGTGEVMSGFARPPQLHFFLNQVIDTDLK